MKFFVVGFAVLALASAGIVSVDYLPPVQELAEPTVEYLPPVGGAVAEEATVLADDGYRYKTVKRIRYRHRRDVNEIANEYLPPVEEAPVEIAAPVAEVAQVAESAVLADDGYRYKTVKRIRYRHRRDVNEIANEYLPPVEEAAVEIAAPVAEVAQVAESAVLADDGYRYKTVKRIRYRHRRDVNEIANEYLPPVEEAAVEIAAPVAEVAQVAESAVLADDGYRYKTVKRIRYRHRRDVNEIANEYLPPVEEAAVEIAAPVAEVAQVAESASLADDGYRYKTVKRIRYRHRRDVNEIANEYLPPVEEAAAVEIAAPVAEVAQVAESAVLADDGYRYKTVKRIRYRHRRDVNEIANEYLPPVEEAAVEIAAPVAEVAQVAESAVLADDGYRYKTVKRIRYRHRRDVNEIANEYLPPVEEAAVEIAAPVAEVAQVAESAVLADDGYRYKTVKRIRYRHRRDVNEIANEYLPPVEEAAIEIAAPVAEVAQVAESAVLADDGYRYKTVKRIRYRHRRDVNEIANEYLPPVDEVVEIAAPVVEAAPAVETAVLSADGYKYRTVKKLRYRHRH